MLEAVMETVPAGRRVRVARLGAGPPLVLLHGYPDNLQIFGELAPRLAATHDVITFDWPGMGRSEPWPGGATPDHMADRLVALLDAWGIDRTSVVAMDMGGQPALSFAARHPGRLDRLVVMNSLVFPDDATSWEIAVLRRYGWNRFLLERLPGPVFRRAIRTSLPRGERLPPEVQRELWSCFREPAIRGFIAKLCAGYQGTLPSLVALYPRVACPTLVLWGERDRHFPRPRAASGGDDPAGPARDPRRRRTLDGVVAGGGCGPCGPRLPGRRHPAMTRTTLRRRPISGPGSSSRP